MPTLTRDRDHRFPLVTAIAFAVVACEVLRTAWVSDDAYITYRTADNLVHGFGPVWNVGERVQGFTHPLWLAVYSALYALTREAYYTGIALGGAITIATLAVLRRSIATRRWPFIVAAAALVSSKAFVDFSTAGLENPLSHLLIVVFLWCWWRGQPARPEGGQGDAAPARRSVRLDGLRRSLAGEDRLLPLTLIASLCVLTRIDLALLVGPAVLAEIWRVGPRAAWRPVAAGVAPVVAWELFSAIYYGSLVPNTAFAKLNITMDARTTLLRGYWYAWRTATSDPSTLPTMAVAAWATLHADWRRNWPLVAGLVATIGYVFWIGGDFMLGRFFSVPLVWSAALLGGAAITQRRRVALAIAGGIVGLGLLAPWEPALLSGYGYTPFDNWLRGRAERGPRDNGLLITQFEITDTRRYYFEGNGLLKGRLGDRRPDNPGVEDGLELRAGGAQVVTRYAIGLTGYFAGPSVHIVDVLALTDPLLARLPAIPGTRVGHYQRDIPAGYLESLRANRNAIPDPDLAEYFDLVRFVTTGPVFDLQRCLTAVGFALGGYDGPRQRFVNKMWPDRS